jgi:hypothetical protein
MDPAGITPQVLRDIAEKAIENEVPGTEKWSLSTLLDDLDKQTALVRTGLIDDYPTETTMRHATRAVACALVLAARLS